MSKTFLAFWCCEGLEYLEDISESVGEQWNEAEIMATLSGEGMLAELLKIRKDIVSRINFMSMRAQYNPQRNYELYTFNTDETMDKDDIMALFDSDPQFIVDWIRENGQAHVKKMPTSKRVIV